MASDVSSSSNIHSGSCTSCNQYLKVGTSITSVIPELLKHIETLEFLLNDNFISFRPMKSIKKEKPVPDTMKQIDLSEERLEYIVNEYYNEEIFEKGYKGVIEFIRDVVVKDDDSGELVYICADPVKKIFHYYDDHGLQRDIRCKIMMDSLYDPLLKRVNKIYKGLIDKIYKRQEDVIVIKTRDSDDDETDDEDDLTYDSEVEEVIATELVNNSNTVDENLNKAVALFLEIKKALGRVRKPVVDELITLLSI